MKPSWTARSLSMSLRRDGVMNDEMMRQWEQVSKEDEEITVKRSEGGKLQVETVQGAPALVVVRT